MQTAAEIYDNALTRNPVKEPGCNQEVALFFRDLIATPVVQKQIREARWAGKTDAYIRLGHVNYCRPCFWPPDMDSHSQIKPLLDRLRQAGCFEDLSSNNSTFSPVLPSISQEQGLENLAYEFSDDSMGHMEFRAHWISFKFKKPE